MTRTAETTTNKSHFSNSGKNEELVGMWSLDLKSAVNALFRRTIKKPSLFLVDKAVELI